MGKEISSRDFTDDELRRFTGSIDRLTWSAAESVPEWVRREADVFSDENPRPSPEDIRLHVDHAVAVARGWDQPDDREVILHSALKSFYTLAWLSFLQERQTKQGGNRGKKVDMSMAVKVSFTPHIRPGGVK